MNETSISQSTRSPGRTTSLEPNPELVEYFAHEQYFRRGFLDNLAAAGIHTVKDLERRTAKEIFAVAPTSSGNRRRFMSYVNRGFLRIAPEPRKKRAIRASQKTLG